MFLTAREWFRKRSEVHPRGRKRRIAKLFVFEFTIVVLGVLAAQMLQNQVVQNTEIRRGNTVASQMEQAALHFAAIANVGQRNESCFRERLTRLSTVNRLNERMSVNALGRPNLSGVYEFEWGSAAFREASKARGHVFTSKAQQLVGVFEDYDRLAAQIENNWRTVGLLDPSNGPLSVQDRAEIRNALLDIQADWTIAQRIYRTIDGIVQDWKLSGENSYLDHHLPDLQTCQFTQVEAASPTNR
ncbi:hypothetical protein HME9302_02135 [Alteripontixanthobacter maritimus]|uniref:Uncharacterized protein n=1 Tax=Alteripontixanthobacter maritimus TaxID=2161824 RepID=A0A369QF42_9SPHN|nr:hypothetical protein [Alteripontixanthobacter maritimus]RDC60918.1 hypothetical protein HME9302_02135 [Alteripontixanthobacter maritimus]